MHVDESGTGWVDPCGACGFCKFPRGVAYEYIEVADYTRAELADLDEDNPSILFPRDCCSRPWRSSGMSAALCYESLCF